jgi:RNA polymerase sigma factor (sigma-70 family)
MTRPPCRAKSLRPEQLARQRELAENLRISLARLPAREAQVLYLRYFSDMSYDEIAGQRGIETDLEAISFSEALR